MLCNKPSDRRAEPFEHFLGERLLLLLGLAPGATLADDFSEERVQFASFPGSDVQGGMETKVHLQPQVRGVEVADEGVLGDDPLTLDRVAVGDAEGVGSYRKKRRLVR
jgi:hypothetical protein